MFEYTLRDLSSVKCITMAGRIDALSYSNIQKVFEDLILAGERTLVVDMAGVNYVSSAGLRVFIVAQKELRKVGGEVVLAGITDPVFEIFRMSGFTQVFRTIKEAGEIEELLGARSSGVGIVKRETFGISLEYMERKAEKGSFLPVGDQSRAENASFREEDVTAVRPSDMVFGCGLAALGSSYGEYKDLFGEAMVVKNNFFFYPAVKQPSVDFVLNAHKDPGITYKVLHGFGFNGEYRYVLSFQAGNEGAADLPSLINSFFEISSAKALGISMVAESKGLWGMHIKRTPIEERKPANGKGIFDSENFTRWIDFPVEPAYTNHVIVATGIAVRDRAGAGPEKQAHISEGSAFHLHCGIFDKAPIGTCIDEFDDELARVFDELSVYKVQHLLGRSRFSAGMAALIELED